MGILQLAQALRLDRAVGEASHRIASRQDKATASRGCRRDHRQHSGDGGVLDLFSLGRKRGFDLPRAAGSAVGGRLRTPGNASQPKLQGAGQERQAKGAIVRQQKAAHAKNRQANVMYARILSNEYPYCRLSNDIQS